MTTLLSYNNDPKLKRGLVRQLKLHRKQDQIVQGTYGKMNGEWKGCSVACAMRSLDIMRGNELRVEYESHADLAESLQVPEWLVRLNDTIFEGLPKEQAPDFSVEFWSSIPLGKNLEPVKWKFCAFLMRENIERVLALKIEDKLKEQVVSAIRQVLAVNESAIATGKWNESAARSAWSAAWSAESARSAAWSAESAWSAAWSAESARSAAWSAYQKFASTLISILNES